MTPHPTASSALAKAANEVKNQDANKALPRYRRDPQASGQMVLQERDLALLEDLWRYRCLTTSQLETLRGADPDERLRFASRLPLTRRLKLLFHHRYLDRIARPCVGGSLEPVYVLDREGARALSCRHGEARFKAPSQQPKPAALQHLLGIAGFRVALEGACARRDDLRLRGWRSGSEVRFSVALSEDGQFKARRVTLIPDGFALVSRLLPSESNKSGEANKPGEANAAPRALNLPLFLEVDLGTEPSRVLTDKARAYYAYWQSGGFAGDFGVAPRQGFYVLFVAPTPKRAATLLGAVQALPRGQSMFRVALEGDITPERLREAVWAVPGQREPQALLEDARP